MAETGVLVKAPDLLVWVRSIRAPQIFLKPLVDGALCHTQHYGGSGDDGCHHITRAHGIDASTHGVGWAMAPKQILNLLLWVAVDFFFWLK